MKPWLAPNVSAKVETLMNTAPVAGNHAELLIDGDEFYEVFLDLIREAQHTVDLTTFLWCDDSAGVEVARALEQARRDRGVRVRVIVDHYNTKPHDQVYEILSDAGAGPLIFNPPWWGMNRLNDHGAHEKVLIVDGKRSLIGGANLCDEYMVGGERGLWHDLQMLVEGPVLERIQSSFDSLWNELAQIDFAARIARSGMDFDRPAASRVYPVYDEPTPSFGVDDTQGNAIVMLQWQHSATHSDQGERFLEGFASLIDDAETSLVWYTPYFTPPERIMDALKKAVTRGVDVSVVTNAPEVNDVEISRTLMHAYEAQALAAGVKVREYFPRTLHAKGMFIDGALVTVGSHNMTHRSFFQSSEANLMTNDPGVIKTFSEMVEDDRKFTRTLERKTVEERAFGKTLGVGSIIARWLRAFF